MELRIIRQENAEGFKVENQTNQLQSAPAILQPMKYSALNSNNCKMAGATLYTIMHEQHDTKPSAESDWPREGMHLPRGVS